MILGCAMPEAEQGLNVARIASLRAGVPVTASAVTVNRFCSSGLQAIAYAAERIMAGSARSDRRRRHRVDEPGADGRPQGRRRIRRWSTAIPDVYLTHRAGRREPRARAPDLARGAGRVRAAQPPAGARRDRRRPLRRRDRSACTRAVVDRDAGRYADAAIRCSRRGAAARHVARGAREAEAGLPRQRHGHRRQLVADERRRGSRARHGGGAGQGARPHAARPLRRLRHRRRRARALRHRAGAGDPQGAEAGRA